MDELAAYFYEHVLLPLVRYHEIKVDGMMGSDRDRRAALDAATALYHLREHIPPPHQKTRPAIAATCPDYDLLADVVNASKHARLSRGTPQIASVDDIYQVQVCTKFKDEQGEFTHAEKCVTVKLLNGTERDLFDVLINVYDFWVQELTSIGAKATRYGFSNPPTGLVARKDAKQIQLKITEGIRWTQHFRFQEYDYDTGQITPIDLSNRENIVFTVREPLTYEFELHSSDGATISRQLKLTATQTLELQAINGEAERQAFLLRLAEENGLTQKLLVDFARQRDDDTV